MSGWLLGAVIAGPAVCEGVRAAHSEGCEQFVDSELSCTAGWILEAFYHRIWLRLPFFSLFHCICSLIAD